MRLGRGFRNSLGAVVIFCLYPRVRLRLRLRHIMLALNRRRVLAAAAGAGAFIRMAGCCAIVVEPSRHASFRAKCNHDVAMDAPPGQSRRMNDGGCAKCTAHYLLSAWWPVLNPRFGLVDRECVHRIVKVDSLAFMQATALDKARELAS